MGLSGVIAGIGPLRRGPPAIRALILGLGLVLLGTGAGGAAQDLVALARVGPWPGVSELIGYRERLWFVNSVKFVNHNSADLYSYDPATGTVRYERHLFSQDAGQPTVAGGLLFWPFEDARFSAGRGEYMVTNGRDWQWRALPDGVAFHLHAMTRMGAPLFAATSAWRAGLQRSDDLGRSWRVLYDHPTEPGFVSRITSLGALGETLYAGLTAWAQAGVKLLRLEGDKVTPVAGWPQGKSTRALTSWRGWIYAVNSDDRESGLWRTDGGAVERIGALDGEQVRALAGGEEALWLVSIGKAGGALWRSRDGLAWERAQSLGDEPLDLAVFAGRVYVGALGADGQGALWGPPAPAPAQAPMLPAAAPPPLPAPSPPLGERRLRGLLEELDRVLVDARSYAPRGRAILRALGALVGSGRPRVGAALSERLGAPFPAIEVALFGGNLEIPAATLARWYLMRAIALSGGGRVPAALLAAPFGAPPNGAEKYFEAAPGAAFAAAQLGQGDDETLAALIDRLGHEDDPLWLVGDVVGALSALSGERLGYDREAWRAWWRRRHRAD